MPTQLDASNVEVAGTGRVLLAPEGTDLPTDGASSLNGDWTNVGYLSEDGVVETPEADTEEIQAWQNGDIVRTVQTSHTITYQFTMIETNEASLKAYYGHYAGGDVQVTGQQLPRQSMIIETVDDGRIRRRVIPVAQVTERGEVQLSNSEAAGYDVTLTCYPDDSGVKVYIYAPVEVNGGEG